MKRYGVLLAIFLAIPLQAADVDRDKHKFRLGLTMTTSTGGFETGTFRDKFFFRETSTTEADGGSAFGLQAGYEFRPVQRLGIALAAEAVSVDMGFREIREVESFDFISGDFVTDTARAGADGELSMTPVTLAAHVYLTRGSKVDVYVGPVVGYVFYGDLKEDSWFASFENNPSAEVLGEPVKWELENDNIVGGIFGLDLNLGQGAGSFHVAAAYYDGSTVPKDEEAGFEIDVDPIVLRAGVVFRF